MAVKIERKYQLIKVKAGDWLLPANDDKTVWRLRQYEDGPSHGLDWPADKTFWMGHRWEGSADEIDIDDWDRWEYEFEWCETREEAIQQALALTEET
jgi:hypothetical protein